MGGVQTQILTPPPPLWEVRFIEVVRTTFGPNLARKAPRFFFFLFFFFIWWGLKFYFTLCVHAQNAQNFVGNSNVHAKHGKFLHP